MNRILRAAILVAAIAAFLPGTLSAQPAEGTAVEVDAQLRRRLNTFFSNFSEAGIRPFRAGAIPGETLIQFGVLHNVINAPQRFQSVPGSEGMQRIPARQIEATVQKYFGVAVPRHKSLTGAYEWIRFSGGFYLIPAADGETRPFSQISRLSRLPNGEYLAAVNVYMGEPAFEDWHGTPESWRRAGDEVERIGTIQARIRRVRENGEERFILLEYLETPPR